MVENKKTKREKDIKSKLLAAIAMLLVSSIMMVSTTYAWFTLSTAPEVTGITTAVGANGNLEIALLPNDGALNSITTAVGDSMAVQIPFLANVTWGNLVDLSDDDNYGTNKFVLNPSKLGAAVTDENGNPTQLNTTYFLQFPEYGSDGRITDLSEDTVTSVYNQTDGFVPNELYGVRALGVSSGMTPRQLAYRNARGAASTATSQAKNEAYKSLEANGNTLANIAVKKATGDAAYTAADVTSMRAIITDLQTKVLPQIETAYLQYILAYAASAATDNELAWKAVESAVTADDAELLTVLTDNGDGTYSLSVTGEDGSNISVALPGGLNTAIAKYAATLAQVESADTEVKKLEDTLAADSNATFTWAEISTALKLLADPDGMIINGYTPDNLMKNINDFAKDVMKNGVTVVMETGGGVYADVADHCGDYSANVVIEKIEYNGVELEDMEAKMQTESAVSPSYLTLVGAAVTDAGAPANTGTVMPLSDMYGYIIDLAFRTNAANSNLLLQADALDRIYSDNSNDETMGHGATMTFASTTPDFTNEQVIKLMGCIRIVFFDPDTGNVYATAKLDVENAEATADGVTAKMYVYELEAPSTTTYAVATDTTDTTVTYYTMSTQDVYTEATDTTDTSVTYYTKDADGNYTAAADTTDTSVTYYTKSTEEVYTEATDTTDTSVTYYTATTTTGAVTETKVEDNVITSLPQNQAIKLSVLVYLDGETITNGDVANAATSMTGSLNLQFSSSAALVPMEYGDLHIVNGTAESSSEANGG